MKQSYKPTHRSDISPGFSIFKSASSSETQPSDEGFANSRVVALTSLTGLALATAFGIVSLENSSKPEKEDAYVDTDLDCRQFVLHKIPYKLESNNVKGLIRQIKTVDHKGPLEDGPCYDEALELVKQQVDPEYPYYGEVILPKFLVPEGMTLRELKNDIRSE